MRDRTRSVSTALSTCVRAKSIPCGASGKINMQPFVIWDTCGARIPGNESPYSGMELPGIKDGSSAPTSERSDVLILSLFHPILLR